MKPENLDALINLCARRGIILPAFSIYGEIGGFYDYGPIGTLIKNKIVAVWRNTFIRELGNLEIEATIIAPQQVFEASGHLATFTDPITKCKKCNTPYRADKLLLEYYLAKNELKKADLVKQMTLDQMYDAIKAEKITCAKDKGELGKVEPFNLMLGTKIGSLAAIQGHLRPETAQGMFLDFKSLYKTHSVKLPIGVGQVGKAFRNEISPRNILIRMREFSQMEIEFFFDPEETDLVINNQKIDDKVFSKKINFYSEEDQLSIKKDDEYSSVTLNSLLEAGTIPNKLFAYLLAKEAEFLEKLGFASDSFRFREILEDELPHYSMCNVDIEVRFNNGWEELSGTAYRTDFDLKNHEKHSKQDMSVTSGTKKLVPHVVEFAIGVDRLFWTLLANSLYLDEERGWEVLLLKDTIAPYKYAIFPLQKDDKLVEKADELNRRLIAAGIDSYYSATSSIGKRYAKADEIGVPYAVTFDFQTLEDGTATVRTSKDAKQTRKKLEEIM